MIKKKEIQHIANLAHLGLDKKELNSMHKDFSSILEYVKTLEEVDVSKIKNVFSKKGLTNVTREDMAEKTSSETRKKLLDLVPEKKGDYFKTKKVL